MESEKELNMQESEQEADVVANDQANVAAKKPEANDLQKLMKERFGDAKFGTLMNSIVDEMFKNMAEVSPTYGGTEGVEGAGGAGGSKSDISDKHTGADDADKLIGTDDGDGAGKVR